MKLECFFKYLKQITSYHVIGTYETVYIYEYSAKRPWQLADRELILYMVVKANKDNFAENKFIKKGFYTFGQAKDYAKNTYNLGRELG